jgi:hypothetical protein
MRVKNTLSVTAPAVEPITLDEALRFCRVDDGDESALVQTLIAVAREQVELTTGTALISQQFKLIGPSWADLFRDDDNSGDILPGSFRGVVSGGVLDYRFSGRRADWNTVFFDRSPLLSVDSVQYYDLTETLATFDPSNYLPINVQTPVEGALNPSPQTGGISIKSTAGWPSVYDRPDAVQITFTSGFGTLPSHVPQNLRHAMLFLVKHFYDNRDAFTVASGSAIELPWSVKHLLESRKSGGWVS